MGGPPLWPGSIMNVYTGGTRANCWDSAIRPARERSAGS